MALANAPGTGIADDKAVYAYVPQIIKYYLGEDMILPNVPTFICADQKQCDHVLANLDIAGGQTDERIGRIWFDDWSQSLASRARSVCRADQGTIRANTLPSR